MLPGLCGIRVSSVCVCVWLTVGGGVLRLGEEGGWVDVCSYLCVVVGMCGDASRSDDMYL